MAHAPTRNVRDIPAPQLAALVGGVQEILWLTETGEWDPDKEWDSAADHLDMIATLLIQAGLRPS